MSHAELYRLGVPVPGSARARQVAAKESEYFRVRYMTPARADDPNAGKPCWHCGKPSTETVGPKGPQSCNDWHCQPTFAQQFGRLAKVYGGGNLGELVLVRNHNGYSFAEMLAAADSVGEGAALREWHRARVAEGCAPCW